MNYTDKVVIITGGSKGIGAGCVRAFVEAGARVVFCARTEPDGQVLATDANQRGPGEALFLRCDVSQVNDIKNLIETTIARHQRLDCLINNAAWHPPHRPIDDFSIEDFRRLLELNLISIFAACKFALPHLRQTQGNIINLSSLVGSMGQLHATTYVATKGAVTAFTKALALEEAENGVRVNSVSPGNIYTPLWQEAIDAAPNGDKCRREGELAQPDRIIFHLSFDIFHLTLVDSSLRRNAKCNLWSEAASISATPLWILVEISLFGTPKAPSSLRSPGALHNQASLLFKLESTNVK